MQSYSSTSSIFSTRELRRLQRLYRSREMAHLRRTFKANSALAESAKANYVYNIYGSRGRLSPNHRTLLRTQLNQFEAFKNVSVKFTVFSTAISQSVRAFSQLREVRSLLKGSAYQMSIQAIHPVNSNVFSEGDQHFIQSKLSTFFDYLKSVRFSEENTRDFAPSLIFVPTNQGPLSPRRQKQFNFYASSGISQKEALFIQSGQLMAPSIFVFSNILYTIEKAGELKNASTKK